MFLVSCLVNWYMMERKENTKCRFRASIHFIQKILTCLTAKSWATYDKIFFVNDNLLQSKTISSRKNKLFVDMKSIREKDRRLGFPGLCSTPQDTGYWRCKGGLIKEYFTNSNKVPPTQIIWPILKTSVMIVCQVVHSSPLRVAMQLSSWMCHKTFIWTNFNRILTFEPQSSSLPHSSSCFKGGILRLRRNGPQVWRIKNIFIYHLYWCLYPPWLACRPPYNHRDSHRVCLIN